MSPKILILSSLRSLEDEKFAEFCDALVGTEDEPRFMISEVQKKNRIEVARLLVSRCSTRAVDRTIKALKAIGCNAEADELESSRPSPKVLPQNPPNVPGVRPGLLRGKICGETKLLVGKYKGRSFDWLVQNDKRYAGYLVGSHRMEREKGHNAQNELMKNKDALSQYVTTIPEVEEEVHFYREGQAPVGCGKFKKMTREDLYKSKDEKHKTCVQWFRSRKKTDGNPDLEATVKYIHHCDKTSFVYQFQSPGPDVTHPESRKRAQAGTSSQLAAKKQRKD